MTTRTEAADLAHTILADSEDEHPVAAYILNVREARTLAHAALAADRVEALADNLDADAAELGEYGGTITAYTTAIRTALNGETHA